MIAELCLEDWCVVDHNSGTLICVGWKSNCWGPESRNVKTACIELTWCLRPHIYRISVCSISSGWRLSLYKLCQTLWPSKHLQYLLEALHIVKNTTVFWYWFGELLMRMQALLACWASRTVSQTGQTVQRSFVCTCPDLGEACWDWSHLCMSENAV